MSGVYVIQDEAKSIPMTRIHCRDEEKELQLLLENNPDLLPGSQIKPDDPRRWLLIKREMPVPDPSTGEARWSIDHFFVDQTGIPTFVECKRFLDTRSRREVVGQMLEYAANGPYYWDREVIRRFADETSRKHGVTLAEALRKLEPESGEDVDEFLEVLENNLREGQVRLVFFMEEAPQELKSIVDFLNKQMERSEVLIIEARQYMSDGVRIVAPTLFGFTEEARRVKKTVTVTSRGRKKWDREAFFQDAGRRLGEADLQAVESVFDFACSGLFQMRWGSGKSVGSFSLIPRALSSRSLLTVFSDGTLWINFGYMEGSPEADAFVNKFAIALQDKIDLSVPDDFRNKFLSFRTQEWAGKASLLIQEIQLMIQQSVI